MSRILVNFAAFAVALLCAVSPAMADNLGSVVGGTAATQSGMAGGVCLTSPAALINGKQAGLVIDCTTHGLIVTPSSTAVQPTSQAPWTALAGTQTNLSVATATAPTVPATATILVAQAQGTNNTSGVCLYWQDDGTNPTASAGQQMSASQTLSYIVTGLPIKFIAATGATCTVTLSYYKATP